MSEILQKPSSGGYMVEQRKSVIHISKPDGGPRINISNPFPFKVTHENVRYYWNKWRPHSDAIDLMVIITIKNEVAFLRYKQKQVFEHMSWEGRRVRQRV